MQVRPLTTPWDRMEDLRHHTRCRLHREFVSLSPPPPARAKEKDLTTVLQNYQQSHSGLFGEEWRQGVQRFRRHHPQDLQFGAGKTVEEYANR